MSNVHVVAVAGVGPGNGAALAERFASGGCHLALLSRDIAHGEAVASRIKGSRAYRCDVSDAVAVSACFKAIAQDLGPVDTLLYNAGNGVFADIESITAEQLEQAWRVNTLGAFLCAREVIPAMKAKKKGNIVFIGATASRRGGKNSAAFAPAKAAQRSLAESMARSLWPAGIHVALIVIDGVVDLERTRAAMPQKPAEFFVDPAGVAAIAWQLTGQSRQAWSFELEARPFGEVW